MLKVKSRNKAPANAEEETYSRRTLSLAAASSSGPTFSRTLATSSFSSKSASDLTVYSSCCPSLGLAFPLLPAPLPPPSSSTLPRLRSNPSFSDRKS